MAQSPTAASSMAYFKSLALTVLLVAPVFGARGQAVASGPETATAAQACMVSPPRGPFHSTMDETPAPPTAGILPSNAGAWSTWITPGLGHRWDSKQGLVESLDGSLQLHGIASAPDGDKSRLHVVVLVDFAPATSAVITAWDGEREQRLDRITGSRVRVDAEGTAVAFDIELPRLTVPDDRYREIQTFVWLEGGRSDARRWTVYSGPNPPAAVECVAASEAVPLMPGRTQLESDGHVVIRAPRAATLAVVPFRESGPGEAKFVRIDEAKRGWSGQLGAGTDVVAVWEAPFTGPGTNWISSFWSARATIDKR